MAIYKHPPIKVPRFHEDNGFYTTPQRSKTMSKIRGKHTKPEVLLRKKLYHLGFRYRLNVKSLPGVPDIVLNHYKVVVFVDGEFWHGYNWEQKRDKIRTNKGFWIPKIERNIQRDQEVTELLQQQGWMVLRFWEQEVRKDFSQCLAKVISATGSLLSDY